MPLWPVVIEVEIWLKANAEKSKAQPSEARNRFIFHPLFHGSIAKLGCANKRSLKNGRRSRSTKPGLSRHTIVRARREHPVHVRLMRLSERVVRLVSLRLALYFAATVQSVPSQ